MNEDAMSIRLLLACRDKDLALTLCAKVIHAPEGSRIVCEATDMIGLVPQAVAVRPDVLLLEHTLAEENRTWQVLGRMRLVSESTRRLLLCDAYTHDMIIDLVRRGVDGCVVRTSEPSLMAKAVIAVYGGQTWFGRTALLDALRSQIVDDPSATSAWTEEHELLTERERQILGLIGDALSNKEIARRLKISDHTVKTHLHHIYVKLQRSGRYKAFLSNGPLGAIGQEKLGRRPQ